MTQPAVRKPTRAIVLAGLGTLVVLRLLLSLAAPAQLHHSEEFINLRLAAALLGDSGEWARLEPGLEGPSAPTEAKPEASLFDYQYQAWDGGTLVLAVLLVPIALIGGLSIGTVKAGAILWSLAIALAWIALLGRLWGDAGRCWAALAFAAVPVPYLVMSTVLWGNHFESSLFLPLVLLLLVDASRTDEPRGQALRVAGAGFLAGFGTWFSLLNGLPMLLVALALPLFLGKRSLLAAPIFAGGGVLGFLPWLGRNDLASDDAIGAQGVGIRDLLVGRPEGPMTPDAEWLHGTWPRLGSWDLHGLWSPDQLGPLLDGVSRGGILTGGLLALVLAVLALRSDSQARLRLAIVGILGLCWILLPVLLDRSWQLADRRLAPLYPAGWVLLVMGVLSVPRAHIGRKVAATVATGVLLLNLGCGLRLIASWDRPERSLRPWTHYALPTAEPRLRIEAGVADLTAAEAAPFYEAFAGLLRSSTSDGRDELLGLRRVMTPGSGDIEILRRPAPACPDDARLERAPPQDIASPGEAAGFGAGLALRCSEQLDTAIGHCRSIPSPALQSACLEHLGVEVKIPAPPSPAPHPDSG